MKSDASQRYKSCACSRLERRPTHTGPEFSVIECPSDDCAKGNSYALSSSHESDGDRLTCGYRVRKRRSLLCSTVFKSNSLDLTAEERVPLSNRSSEASKPRQLPEPHPIRRPG